MITRSQRLCATVASTLDLRNPLVRRFLGTSEHELAREAPLNAHITALILISSIPLRQVKGKRLLSAVLTSLEGDWAR